MTKKPVATQDSEVTAEQQAYALVKARIMDLTLKPGQNISDREIAEVLNISRTPIREAFRRLEYEGLLTSQPRHGWQVCPLTLADIHEIFDLKHILQGMIARQAATCDDKDLQLQLKNTAELMGAASDANDIEKWNEAHARWHNILFAMSTSPQGRAFHIIENLNDQWRRILSRLRSIEGWTARDTQDHQYVTEGILSGDADEAERRMQLHLDNVRREVVNLLVNLVFPYSPDGV